MTPEETKFLIISTVTVVLIMLTTTMIQTVQALQITGILKPTGVEVGINKGYYLTDIQITQSKIPGKAVGILSTTGSGQPVVFAGPTAIQTMGDIQVKVSPTETKMISFVLMTKTNTVKKVGVDEIFDASGHTTIGSDFIQGVTSKAVITNGDTGTLYINMPNK